MATTHDASCRCFNCRARRAARNVETPPTPGEPLDMGLEDNPDKLTEDQILAIQNNPLAFAIASKENDVSDRDIEDALSQAGLQIDEIVQFMDQTDAHMQATRRKRGFKRILMGIGTTAIGIAVSVVTALVLPGEFLIVATGAFLYAVYCVIRGLYEVLTSWSR